MGVLEGESTASRVYVRLIPNDPIADGGGTWNVCNEDSFGGAFAPYYFQEVDATNNLWRREVIDITHEITHIFAGGHTDCYDPKIEYCSSSEEGDEDRCYAGPDLCPPNGEMAVSGYCTYRCDVENLPLPRFGVPFGPLNRVMRNNILAMDAGNVPIPGCLQAGGQFTGDRFADLDGDEFPDDLDNCPSDSDPTQLDTDLDGAGDIFDNCELIPNPAQNVCEGDCNEDCVVGIGDLILAVNVSLANTAVSNCVPADVNGDGDVSADELLRGLRSALDGCFEPVSAPQVYDPVQIDIGHSEGVVGANVDVPITMTSADDAAGVRIDILYESILGEVTDPSSDCTLGSALSPTQHSISAGTAPLLPAPPGFSRLRVTVLPKSLVTPMPVGLTGEVAVCTFAVDGNAPPDTYDLTVDLAEVSDEDAHEMTVVHTDGTLRVCPGCACQ